MPRTITPGRGPSPSPTEESMRSDTSKRKTAAYSPDDEVMIIDTGFELKPSSSLGKQSTKGKVKRAKAECAMSSDHTIPKGLSRVKKVLSIITRLVKSQKNGEALPSTADIMVYARSRYNFFPSHIEVVEARDRYKERHPQIIDNEESQRLSKPLSPSMTQAFSMNKPMQTEQSVLCDVCRLSVNFGAYTVTLEGPSVQELEKVAKYIGAVLSGVQL